MSGSGRTQQLALIESFRARLLADATIDENTMGIWHRGSVQQVQQPGIYWSIVFGGLEEVFESLVVQWDVYTKDVHLAAGGARSAAVAAFLVEDRMRILMHRDTPMTIDLVGGGTLTLFSLLESARDADPVSGGWARKILTFRYQPVRLKPRT